LPDDRNRVSPVTSLGYGLDDRWRGLGIFLFTTASIPALGLTQSSIHWVTVSLSLGVKRPGRRAEHSLPSNTEVKNEWSYTSTPQYAYMAWCSSVKAQEHLTLPHSTLGGFTTEWHKWTPLSSQKQLLHWLHRTPDCRNSKCGL